ncbi:MAG: hypothetical protein Q8878_07925, partial [Bacillota bacterium]|nr:hypothetical protein [Bacillota bacterium]
NNDALSSDDKDELSKLVASTAAIDPSKVTIYASAFYNPEDQEKENGEAHVGAPSLNFMALLLSDPTLLLFAGAGLLALLLLIFLLKSIAKKRKRKKEKMAEPAALGQTENKKGFKGKLKKKKHKKGEPEEAEGAMGFGPDNKKIEQPPEAAAEEEEIQPLKNLEPTKEAKIKKELQEFSSDNPEISAQLIKSLLKGEDRHG